MVIVNIMYLLLGVFLGITGMYEYCCYKTEKTYREIKKMKQAIVPINIKCEEDKRKTKEMIGELQKLNKQLEMKKNVI